MFGKNRSDTGAYDYLIVGLGNPGASYETTRHNAGFLCVTLLEDRYSFQVKKLRFHALVGETRISGERVLVMKPQTFMNNSGEAVGECAAFYKFSPEKIIVISDDVSLPPGTVRVRRKGSAGGHNGLKSIIEHIGSEEFPRIKLGVGDRPTREYDLADWVLGKFPKDQIPLMREAMGKACDALEVMVGGDITAAMSQYNG